jgi:hypothetical protein
MTDIRAKASESLISSMTGAGGQISSERLVAESSYEKSSSWSATETFSTYQSSKKQYIYDRGTIITNSNPKALVQPY